MELGATMELGGGRGSQLEVGNRYPHVQPATCGTTAPGARYYRYHGGPRYFRSSSRGRDLPDWGAVLPLAQYYRSPLRYYRKAGKSMPTKSADEINYSRAYFR